MLHLTGNNHIMLSGRRHWLLHLCEYASNIPPDMVRRVERGPGPYKDAK